MVDWLKQQPDAGAESQTGNTSMLTLLETIKVNHIERLNILGLFIKFTVSELSGSVAITSIQDKPSLSIMYPGTDKPPLVLSRDGKYRSALFVKISDQEYLATASKDEIRLWNPANNTSSVVYKFKEENDWDLCVIDDRTVAYVAEHTSSNGFNNIYTLKTDTEMWTLSSTHSVKMNASASDMSYVKTTDGTPCFLVIDNRVELVQAVELVGGKERWQVGQQQMGKFFHPWSVCTDGSTVFVADFVQHQLHLLSVEDGSVLTSINLYQIDIDFPSCVRLQGEHLYIGHGDLNTYCITKFNKPTEV